MGDYDVIVTDPPWSYWGSKEGMGKVGKEYKTMTDQEILDYRYPLSKRGILFMWCPCGGDQISLAMEAIKAHGLTFRGVAFVWVKTKKDGVTPIGAMGVRASATLAGEKVTRVTWTVYQKNLAPSRERGSSLERGKRKIQRGKRRQKLKSQVMRFLENIGQANFQSKKGVIALRMRGEEVEAEEACDYISGLVELPDYFVECTTYKYLDLVEIEISRNKYLPIDNQLFGDLVESIKKRYTNKAGCWFLGWFLFGKHQEFYQVDCACDLSELNTILYHNGRLR